MGLHTLDIIVLIGYFVIVAVIGILATRLIRNREDYLMGSRRFGKAMMIMFAFGAGTHADSAVGVTSQSYKYGLAGIWYQWIMIFTLPIYWLLAPIFRRARVLTTADFFERRFGRPMMYLYSFFAMFVLISFNGVMFYGAGKVVVALTGGAMSLETAIVLMAVASFIYGIAGGLIAAVWNDFFQGILTIVMSLLIIPFFWSRIGGLEGFQSAVTISGHPNSQNIFSLVLQSDMTIYWIVMMTIGSLTSMVAQPQILASTAAARSEMDGRVGFVGGMILKRLMTVPWALTGIMAIALYRYSESMDPDHTFGLMSAELLPVGCVGLMLACVMASVMDNCAINMLSFSGIYTNSIHLPIFNPQSDEKRLLLVNRISSLVFAIVSLGLSFLFTDVPAAMRFLWQTVPLMGIPWFFAILWSRSNRWGAMASFLAATAASVTAKVYFQWEGDAGLPYTITLYLTSGIVVGIVVSLLTPPESPRRTKQFFLLLKTPIGQEHLLREAGFREAPGNGTFEMPLEELGGDSDSLEHGTPSLESLFDRIDNRLSRRQSINGFVALLFVVLSMVVGILILADWLAPT